MRTRRRNMRHYVASSIATSRACTLAPVTRQAVISDPPIMNQILSEPATVMLLPPPYSPPECIPYEPPQNGTFMILLFLLLLGNKFFTVKILSIHFLARHPVLARYYAFFTIQ